MLHDLDFRNPADPMPHLFLAQIANEGVAVPDFDAEVRT